MAKKRFPRPVPPAAPWHAGRAGDDYGVRDEPDWRTIDWSEHLRRVEIGGRAVNYVDIGPRESDEPATPVVFVHGISGNWQNWLENIPRFAQHRRVVALDLPGSGESEDPAGKISMSGLGATVDALAEHLDLGEVALVGNSMGGFISAETTIQFPERVERLVLVSAAGITTTDLARTPVMAWGRAIAMSGTRSAAEVRMAILRPRLRHLVFSLIMRHPSRIPADTLFEISKGAGPDAFLDTLKAILEYDFRERLPEIRCPTLIVWGANDAIIPSRDAYEYERLIPGTQPVVMLEDTGHVAMIERPVTFNDTVLEFLDGPTPDQGQGVGEPEAAPA
ncbi:MAG TPA: alpha/beta fold hydrolase [Thermoleophilaceae bacterium]|jgi:pimeloyl-ACP methyl ester carboxylesterase